MWRAAWLVSTGQDALREITMAKLFTSETYVKIANQGMQVLGGFGYCDEFDMERHLPRRRAPPPSPPAPRRFSATSSPI